MFHGQCDPLPDWQPTLPLALQRNNIYYKPKRLLSSIHQVLQALHDDEHVVHAYAHEEEGHDRVEVCPEQTEVEAGAHARYLCIREEEEENMLLSTVYKIASKKVVLLFNFLKI